MTEHILKVHPEYFRELEYERKGFEVRPDDRDPRYEVGDTLLLREWNPTGEVFTGKEVSRLVTYKAVPSKHVPLTEGWCVLSIITIRDAPGVVPKAHVDDAVSVGPGGMRSVYLIQCFGVFHGEDLQAMFADEGKAIDYKDASRGDSLLPLVRKSWSVRPVRVSRASW